MGIRRKLEGLEKSVLVDGTIFSHSTLPGRCSSCSHRKLAGLEFLSRLWSRAGFHILNGQCQLGGRASQLTKHYCVIFYFDHVSQSWGSE